MTKNPNQGGPALKQRTSAQEEAAVTSGDKPTEVGVMFFPVVYAVVSSADMEQIVPIFLSKPIVYGTSS